MILDVIIILILLWAVYSGFRKGIVPQVGALVGLVLGVFLSYYLGSAVNSLMNITNPAGKIVSYIVIAGVILFLAVITARFISDAIGAIGLRWLDQAGGAILSLAKYLLLVSVLLTIFHWANDGEKFIGADKLTNSKLYYPVRNLSSYIFPFVNKAEDQIKKWEEMDKNARDGETAPQESNGN